MKKIITILLILLPIILFAQGDNSAKEVEFHEGAGAIEDWFVSVFAKLDVQAMSSATKYVSIAKTIGSLGTLMYLGTLGWKMISGESEFQMQPIIRCFIIGLIIMNWGAFIDLCQAPFRALSSPAETVFTQMKKEADEKRVIRYEKQKKLVEKAIEIKAEADLKKKQMDQLGNENEDGFFNWLGDKVSEGADAMLKPIIEFGIKISFEIEKVLGELIEMLGLIILRVCVYGIFFVQKLWMYILIITGPLAVGMALVPGFENSLYSWVAKFININLYSLVAYTVLTLGHTLIIAGHDQEINRLSTIISDNGTVLNEGALIAFLTQSGFLTMVLFTVVAFIVTAVGMLMVPTIADTIVQAGGGQVMSKIRQNAGRLSEGGRSGGRSAGKIAGGIGKIAGGVGKAIGGAAKAQYQDYKRKGGVTPM